MKLYKLGDLGFVGSSHITEHFKWSEAFTTDTGLDNFPGDYQLANLVQTFRILERVRQYCDFPLIVNSAFRTPDVHKAIYEKLGKPAPMGSYHLHGRAVDLSTAHLNEKGINKLYNNLLTYAPVEIYEDRKQKIIHVAF